MKHQRTLYLKRVSKENAKAKTKSPPVVDDAASTASIESHVSLAVVISPLGPQSVDTDDNLCNLGNIQNVDNVVEIQTQPERSPPPPPPNFGAGIVQSAFTRLHKLLDKFQGRRTPPREYLSSDRRSPTAGPSDIARPNPLAQVSDTASQGPDSAPGSSTATHVPPSSGPSHHDAPSSSEFVSARVGGDEWEHVRAWSRRVLSPERLRDELERTHAEISQLRDMIDYCRARARAPPDHFYRDLDILHSKYDQLSLALAESRQAFAPSRHGRSRVVASPSVASPSDAPRPPRSDSSPFKGLRLSPQPGPSSSGDHRFALQDRRCPRDVSSDLPRRSHFSEERFREWPSDSQRFASRDSPSPKLRRFASNDSLSPKRQGFASRDPLSPKRQGFASRDSLSPKWQRFASKDSPSPKRQQFASGDSHPPKRRRFASGDSDSPQRQHSSRASSGDGSLERPPSGSSPTRPSSPPREDKEAEESSIPAPVRAMIDFILKSFPDAQASPSHPSSRSFNLSAYASVTDATIPPGSLLAWCHALSDAFPDTQQRFARRIKDGKVCHTLLPTLNRFERVSNSPTQGKELKPNPDVLDLLRNRVPDNRHVPLSLKEAAALERSLRSGFESHNFLTWSVVALIRSLH